ncbi:CPNE9 protein, partial [Chloropsis hardwickii]|nr:CPNE9 protein [Chloropsis hardwickii]
TPGSSPRNLLDMDTFSKSDPVVVLFVQVSGSSEWKEFGRTEVIDNTLNPDFVRKFVLDYYFEEKQNLRFDVPPWSHSALFGAQDFLGQAFVALGEVIGSQRGRLERPLTAPTMTQISRSLLAEPQAVQAGWLCWKLVGRVLTAGWAVGLGVPKSGAGGAVPARLVAHPLCAFTFRTVKIDVYDWDRDGSHDFIGEFATSYRELSRAQSQFTVYEVLNPRKKCKKKKYVNSGTVTLLSFSVESEFTFVDYIRGGTQLNFTVAIDFTASNGLPSQPTSLHYASPYQLSAYALALKAVGEIIQDYDSDKLFPAYGFGA